MRYKVTLELETELTDAKATRLWEAVIQATSVASCTVRVHPIDDAQAPIDITHLNRSVSR